MKHANMGMSVGTPSYVQIQGEMAAAADEVDVKRALMQEKTSNQQSFLCKINSTLH